MRRWLVRFLFSLFGAVACAIVVALAEGRTASLAVSGSHAPSLLALILADLSLLEPLALVVGGAVGFFAIFAEPAHPSTLGDHARRLRDEPVLTRSRSAAVAPLVVLVAFTWALAAAHCARGALAEGTPAASGLRVAVTTLGLFAALAACGLALLPWLRRALAAGAAHVPWLVDPVTTGGVSVALAAVLFAWGVHSGDTGGDGGGALGIFGVLKRPELDLRPVLNLTAIALGAYLAPVAFAGRPRGAPFVALAASLAIAPLGMTVVAAQKLGRDPTVARAIERHAPLAKLALATLRKATDRDHDGASAYFGGGDCDDHDPSRSPLAVDIPGNGIDEDCSGADLPAPVATPASAVAKSSPHPTRAVTPDLNIVFITIDTLRIDLGFMGYAKPVSTNLDRLAARGVVFDRAYAMASYTGKSIGPMLIGKYPSETLRDGGHFNTYASQNTFFAERVKKAGFKTFGAASHWYFAAWSGLTQGFDDFDLSAKPPSGQGDTDTSTTSKELADVALHQLARKANTSGRFFAWYHFFDPHAQYMPHEGAPDFRGDAKGGSAIMKAQYEGEVWFTDKHVGRILDFIAAQPWGERTAIVVTADHGETFAEHGMSFHGVDVWEPLVRVPLLVYLPGAAAHHVPVKRGHIDLVPTLMDVAGLEKAGDGELSGESMLDDLLAAPGEDFAERNVSIDMPPGPYTGLRRGILTGKTPGMKLVSSGGAQYQLFDLTADPGELEDLAGDPAKLAPVVDAFQQARSRMKEIYVKPDEPKPPP